jgi:hypothetical protein
MQQDELNTRLMGADRAPVHLPAGATKVEEGEYYPEFVVDLVGGVPEICAQASNWNRTRRRSCERYKQNYRCDDSSRIFRLH